MTEQLDGKFQVLADGDFESVLLRGAEGDECLSGVCYGKRDPRAEAGLEVLLAPVPNGPGSGAKASFAGEVAARSSNDDHPVPPGSIRRRKNRENCAAVTAHLDGRGRGAVGEALNT